MKPVGILLFCLFCMGAQAQKQHAIGVRAGWNYTTITRSSLAYTSNAYAGVYGEVQLGKYFYFQPEFTYSKHGADGPVQLRADKTLSTEDPRVDYLGFGIIGKLALPSEFRLLVGQYFDQAIQLNKTFRTSLDPGITFGAEYKAPFGLGIDLRVKRGFADQLDSDIYQTYGTGTGLFNFDRNSNLGVQLGLNYTFGL
jgi:hypothetical protein